MYSRPILPTVQIKESVTFVSRFFKYWLKWKLRELLKVSKKLTNTECFNEQEKVSTTLSSFSNKEWKAKLLLDAKEVICAYKFALFS